MLQAAKINWKNRAREKATADVDFLFDTQSLKLGAWAWKRLMVIDSFLQELLLGLLQTKAEPYTESLQ